MIYHNIQYVRTREVIEVKCLTKDENGKSQWMLQFWDKDGTLIAEAPYFHHSCSVPKPCDK